MAPSRLLVGLVLCWWGCVVVQAGHLTCRGDTSTSAEAGVSGRCDCRAGWAGPECTVCTSDASCHASSGGTVSPHLCQRTATFARDMYAACQIGTPGLASFLGGPGAILLRVQRPSPKSAENGSVEVQMAGQSGADGPLVPAFQCSAKDCTVARTQSTNELVLTCATTKCATTCIPGTDKFCIPILANMLGRVGSNSAKPFTLVCKADGSGCAIHEGVLESFYPSTGVVLSSCVTGECATAADLKSATAQQVTSLKMAAVKASPLRTTNVTLFWLGVALVVGIIAAGLTVHAWASTGLLGDIANQASEAAFLQEKAKSEVSSLEEGKTEAGMGGGGSVVVCKGVSDLDEIELGPVGVVAASPHPGKQSSSSSSSDGLAWTDVGYSLATAEDDQHHRRRLLSSLARRVVGGKETKEAAVVGGEEAGSSRRQVLLQGVSGEARAGDVVAIMGPSGAGKTTLLDTLSLRDMAGKATGEVRLGRHRLQWEKREAARSRMAYLPQGHMLPTTLTVVEAVTMAAMLRMPGWSAITPDGQRRVKQRVLEAMAALRIQHLARSIIGCETSFRRGLSGGEKRRVAVAMELTADPEVLFLDEPTSGLDSFNAEALVDVLHDVALRRRVAVVLTVHQPKHGTFMRLTRVLLLSKGRAVFFGRPDEVGSFIERTLGYAPPAHSNPADLMIEALFSHDVKPLPFGGRKSASLDASAAAEESKDASPSEAKAQSLIKRPSSPSLSSQQSSPSLQPLSRANLAVQTLVLSQRFLLDHKRRFWILASHLLAALYIAVLLGAMFLNSGSSTSGIGAIQNRMGIFMLEALFLAFTAVSALPMLWLERPMMAFEKANGYYSSTAYFIAKLSSDLIPLRVLPPILLAAITTAMVGFRGGAYFLYYTFALVLLSCVAASLNMLIGVLATSLTTGILAAMILLLHILLLTSIYVNFKTMELPWLGALRYLSYLQYGYEALVSNEMAGRTLTDLPVESGSAILAQLGFKPERLDMDITMLVGYLGVALLGTYAAIVSVRERR